MPRAFRPSRSERSFGLLPPTMTAKPTHAPRCADNSHLVRFAEKPLRSGEHRCKTTKRRETNRSKHSSLVRSKFNHQDRSRQLALRLCGDARYSCFQTRGKSPRACLLNSTAHGLDAAIAGPFIVRCHASHTASIVEAPTLRHLIPL